MINNLVVCTPCNMSLSDEQVNTLLIQIQPEIHQAARSLYYRLPHISLDIEDLQQEGWIGAWQATKNYDPSKVKDEHSLAGYCMKRAHGAMCSFISRSNKTRSTSLEQHLTTDTGTETYQRELPALASPSPVKLTSQHKRIMAALRTLPSRQRQAVMSSFRMCDEYGRGIEQPIDYYHSRNMHRNTFFQARARALKKLAALLEQEVMPC